MIDLNDATLVAVTAALRAGVTLAPVFSVVPEGTQPPVVVIGELSPDVDADKGGAGRLARYEVGITTIVAGDSRRTAYALMAQVDAALTNAALSFPGALLSSPVLLNSSDRLNDDGAAIIGDQRFLIFTQEDD